MNDRFDHFRLNIERKIVDVKSELGHLASSVQTLSKSIDELRDKFGDFTSCVSEMYNEHNSRISALGKTIGK